MATVITETPTAAAQPITSHTRWIRISHWVMTVSFITLAFTGSVILMAHPRLYWGEVGNDLTPPLIELPISRNHRHGGWENPQPFFEDGTQAVTANRTYSIFNKNGWGRSLHFLSAWFLVATGAIYLLAGIFTGHFRRHILPRPRDLAPRTFLRELLDHARFKIQQATGGPHYGSLQKCSYFFVIFIAIPLAIATGLAMSPVLTASYPILLRVFGGH